MGAHKRIAAVVLAMLAIGSLVAANPYTGPAYDLIQSDVAWLSSFYLPLTGGTVTGNVTMNQNVLVGGRLDVAGNANVTGNVTANGNETVAGNITGNQNVTTRSYIAVDANSLVLSATDSAGSLTYARINPNSYYAVYEWDVDGSTANFTQVGNVVPAAVNSVSAPLMGLSTMGVSYVNTSSTTAGGRIARPAAYGIVKSTTINYRWRHIFYMPVASTAGNTYTAFIGSFVATGSANASDVPFAGPYISYTHGTNSGNWVMGSAVNGTRTTGNSSTAPSLGAWNTLQIDLANGTYTFTVNGTSIGTLLDNNITTAQANGQAASQGGIMIIPDGTNFTTNRVLMIDRSEYYVTGLSR